MHSISFAGPSAAPSTALAEAEGGRSGAIQSSIAEARRLLHDGVKAADRASPLAERFLGRLVALGRSATRPDGVSQAERQGDLDEMQSIVDRLAGRAPPNGPPGNYVDLHALVHGYLRAHLQGQGGSGDSPLHLDRGAMLRMLQRQFLRLTPDDPRAMRDLAEMFDSAQAGVRELDRKIAEARESTPSAVPVPESLRAEASGSSNWTSSGVRWTASNVMVNIQHAGNVIDNTNGLVVINMAGGSGRANPSPRPAPPVERSGMGSFSQPGTRGVGSLAIRGAGRAGAESDVALNITSAEHVVIGGAMNVFMGPSTNALRKDGRRIFDQISSRVGPAPQGEMAECLARAAALKRIACTRDKLPKADRQCYVDELRAIRHQVTRRHKEMTTEAKV